MKVLVTGAAGFIGSHIAEVLEERGHDVLGIDTLETGRAENFPAFAKNDVVDLAAYGLKGFDVIAHCAASYADRDNWRRDIRTNVLGAEAVCRAKPQRIVYLQTALCYGHNPYRGHPPWPLAVTQRLNPDNSYAISKTAGELYIQQSGIPYVSLRLANVYGPRNLSGPIPTFYKRLSEGAKCVVADARRDFVYIDDLLPVAIRAVEGHGGGVYHVSSGRDTPILSVYSAVAAALGVDDQPELVARRDGDAPSILLDPEATMRTFAWQPATTLEDGIAAAVDWYREHGVERTFTHLPVAT